MSGYDGYRLRSGLAGKYRIGLNIVRTGKIGVRGLFLEYGEYSAEYSPTPSLKPLSWLGIFFGVFANPAVYAGGAVCNRHLVSRTEPCTGVWCWVTTFDVKNKRKKKEKKWNLEPLFLKWVTHCSWNEWHFCRWVGLSLIAESVVDLLPLCCRNMIRFSRNNYLISWVFHILTFLQ